VPERLALGSPPTPESRVPLSELNTGGYNRVDGIRREGGRYAGTPDHLIAEATTWKVFPTIWRGLIDEVWAAVRSTDQIAPNRNVMLYRDDVRKRRGRC
jgi:hypothetical protein